MIKITRVIYMFLVLAIISLNLATSQTLIAGKIYNSDFSDTIKEAYISVTCNSFLLNTHTLGDGTYAVRFNETECNGGNIVSVSASKSGFQEKTGSGTIIKCEGADCEDTIIINLGLSAPSDTRNTRGSGGSGGGRYYLCGNGKCDTGETINTCPGDCQTIEPSQTSPNTRETEENQIQNLQTSTSPENKGFLSGITGAVIGTLGTAGTILAIIFLIILIGSAVTIRAFGK